MRWKKPVPRVDPTVNYCLFAPGTNGGPAVVAPFHVAEPRPAPIRERIVPTYNDWKVIPIRIRQDQSDRALVCARNRYMNKIAAGMRDHRISTKMDSVTVNWKGIKGEFANGDPWGIEPDLDDGTRTDGLGPDIVVPGYCRMSTKSRPMYRDLYLPAHHVKTVRKSDAVVLIWWDDEDPLLHYFVGYVPSMVFLEGHRIVQPGAKYRIPTAELPPNLLRDPRKLIPADLLGLTSVSTPLS